MGQYLGVNLKGSVAGHLFWVSGLDALSFGIFYASLIKTFSLALPIGIVGC